MQLPQAKDTAIPPPLFPGLAPNAPSASLLIPATQKPAVQRKLLSDLKAATVHGQHLGDERARNPESCKVSKFSSSWGGGIDQLSMGSDPPSATAASSGTEVSLSKPPGGCV